MPPQKKVTPARDQILRLLEEYKCLTTTQIWQQTMPYKRKSQAWEDLDALRSMKLVKGTLFEPEKGTTSEFCWRLTTRGALAMGKGVGSVTPKKEGRNQVLFHTVQMAFRHEVTKAGWLLAEPQTFGNHRTKPAATNQYHILVQALSSKEYLTIQSERRQGYKVDFRVSQYELGMHLVAVPAQANDYVAYTQGRELAVVFILCPPHAGIKFWQGRVEQYQELAGQIKVCGVFRTDALALARKQQLNAAGLVVTTVDRIGLLLRTTFENARKERLAALKKETPPGRINRY